MILKPVHTMELTNDLYILESFNEGFLINRDYIGLDILDFQLNYKMRIDYPDEIVADSILKKFDHSKLAVNFVDQNKLLIINLRDMDESEIFYNNISSSYISNLYSWDDQLIILMENGQFYYLDESNKKISLINADKEIIQRFDADLLQFNKILQAFDYIRIYSDKKSFIYKDFKNNIIGYYSFYGKVKHEITVGKEIVLYDHGFCSQYYDAQYIDEGVFILIGEDDIQIRKHDVICNIYSKNSFAFTRAIPFKVNGVNFFNCGGIQ